MKKCLNCEKEIETAGNLKFCSAECKKLYNWKKKGSPICKICGKPSYNGAVYCSPECLKKGRHLYNAFSQPEVKEKIKNTLIQHYGSLDAAYEQQAKTHQENCIEKYGVKSTFLLPEVQEKIKKTNLERYGVEDARSSQQVKDKREATIKKTGISGRFHTKEWNEAMIEKYGTTVPYKNKELKEKGINTLLKRYGVTSPAKLDFVKEKAKKTCIEKYGVEYSFQSENNKMKSKQTMMEKYGVTNACFLDSHKYTRISKLNKAFGDDLGLEDSQYEFKLGSHYYDFKIGNKLIELNPTFTHNSDEAPIFSRDKKPLSKDYHLKKLEEAVKAFFGKKIKIGARECDVMLIDKKSCDEFLDSYHFQGKCEGDKIRIGLAYKDELVGAPRYSCKADIELLRLCFKPQYDVIGGSEKMFKYFVTTFKPASIISYCDLSKFTGNVYKKLGFTLMRISKPAAHWSKGNKQITDNLLRQRGFSQLFNIKEHIEGTNEELMLAAGWRRVYDCGQSTYLWKRTN
jgi:predicted nucleic acid-binding Zn ribbon protein